MPGALCEKEGLRNKHSLAPTLVGRGRAVVRTNEPVIMIQDDQC